MSNPALALAGTTQDVDKLLSTRTIRERAERVLKIALNGGTHFSVHLSQLEAAADLVSRVTLANYPDLKIPLHSRWGHFQVGGIDRLKLLRERLLNLSPLAQVRAELDLVVVSVLLDAGAGMDWKYFETSSQRSFSRSEGLAVASFHIFLEGLFSSDPAQPYRVDAEGLAKLTLAQFERGFQVSKANPLLGTQGRHALIQSLGKALENKTTFFSHSSDAKLARPGNLLDYLTQKAQDRKLPATQILTALQLGLGSIWPGRVTVGEQNLGDVWPYPELGPGLEGLMPIHKLSQWLTYSLIEPLERSGLTITETSELTGLAEYRNGGLFLDSGVLELRDPTLLSREHAPGSAVIVEWRALTLVLLDRIASLVRSRLGKNETDFPLGKILEGGTWWAGRKLASELRAAGGPPLLIQSDGTVF